MYEVLGRGGVVGWREAASVLIKSGGEMRAFSPPCEDIARRQPSKNQETSFHQILNIADALILDFSASRL